MTAHCSCQAEKCFLVLFIWMSCLYTPVTTAQTDSTPAPRLVGSDAPKVARVGDMVILPCRIEPPRDVSRKTVEWQRRDLEPQTVYLRQDGREKATYQNLRYRDRTHLFTSEELRQGNIALKLFNVELSDQGEYKCWLSDPDLSTLVQLRVEDHSEDDTDGLTGGAITGIVLLIVGVVVLGIAALLRRRFRKKKTGQDTPSTDEENFTIFNPDEKPRPDQDTTHLRERGRGQTGGTTSPTKIRSSSQRWKKLLEKLIDPCEVIKFGTFVIGKNNEFFIGDGNKGTEVYLGLTNDGAGLAVKKMTKRNFKALKNEQKVLRLPKLVDPSIVQYVDSAEDEANGYIALQLCEYNLDEYMKCEHKPSGADWKRLAGQVLQSLSVLHRQNPPILHQDIKPENVLIDTLGNARLADFGIQQRPDNATSDNAKRCWLANEIVLGQDDYTICSDIQVAGMLIYYILSGGGHPFGAEYLCKANIGLGTFILDDVQDADARHLIEWMITKDPEKRPTVTQCLGHPFFWPNERRVEFLRRIGSEEQVLNDQDDQHLLGEIHRYAEEGPFSTWQEKYPAGLLDFIRNLHDAEEMEMLPGLVGCVYKFAGVERQGWFSAPAL